MSLFEKLKQAYQASSQEVLEQAAAMQDLTAEELDLVSGGEGKTQVVTQ